MPSMLTSIRFPDMAERTRRRKKIEAPFPGLRPFLSYENLIFFGRDGQSNELIHRLRQNHFLAVLGSSGSGKSSLVRAGLQPDLESGLMAGVCPNWKIATMRPGDRPIANLAEELAKLVSDPDDVGFQVIPARSMIMTMLQASSFGLKEAALGPILEPNENLLVIVDQFEEIFRFNEEHDDPQKLDEAKTFMRLLLEASSDLALPIYVVITMRSDFLGECPRFNGLAEAINMGQYLVPRLTRAQMREAITGPVAVFKEQIAPDLVIRILNDIGDNPDQLPILQHALMRTWDHHCVGDEIVLADYEEIGGFAHALNQHAEEIYEELDRKGLGKLTEQLFKCLTQLEGDGKGIRRPAHLSEICSVTGAAAEQVQMIVEAFRAPGRTFLMPPIEVPLLQDTVIDISHESFMRLWQRLGAWVREETQSAEEYLRLSGAAVDYKLGKVNLWRQPELGIALKWRTAINPTAAWAARYDDKFAAAMTFLDDSHRSWQNEEENKAAMLLLQRKSEERKVTNRRLITGMVLLGAMLIVAIAALWQAVKQNGIAFEQTELAHQQSLLAMEQKTIAIEQTALAEQKATSFDSLNRILEQTNVELASTVKLVQRQSDTLLNKNRSIGYQNDSLRKVKDRLAKTNSALDDANRFLKLENEEQDSLRRVAEGARDSAKTRSSLLDALQLAERSMDAARRETAALLALRAYNLYIENGGDSSEPKIYTALNAALERSAPLSPLVKYLFPIVPMRMDFDPATAYATVLGLSGELWELRNENSDLHFYPKAALGVNDIRLLGHGTTRKTVILSNLAHQLLVYKIATGHLDHRLTGHTGPITGAIEIPGQDQLVSCDIDGKVIWWNLSSTTGQSRVLYDQAGSQLQALTLHPKGKMAAVGGKGMILMIDAERLSSSIVCKPGGIVTALAFSKTGAYLVFGLEDGTVGFFDMQAKRLYSYPTHRSRVVGLAISPDGKFLASCSYDQTLRLWSTTSLRSAPIVLSGHKSWVTGLGFSADSRELYSISKDKTLRVWYTKAAYIVSKLEQAAPRESFSDPEMNQYNLLDRDVKGGNRK
jgi:hypothetical protein